MNEAYLQYLWKHKRLPFKDIKTVSGKQIEILDFGFLNSDAGPDFFNAKVSIAGQIWAGNVEIHMNASDWRKHNHQSDKAYDNVILHVVFNYDEDVKTASARTLETLELKPFIDKEHFTSYENLLKSKAWIPCATEFLKVDDIVKRQMLEKCLVQRLERKIQPIQRDLERQNNHWEEVFYQYFLSAFGMKVNAEVFKSLAQQTPLNIIQKIGGNALQIEALLLGQSGLLPAKSDENYVQQLIQEYIFLKAKFNLVPLSANQFKFSQLRPANFPTLRLAQLAQLFAKKNTLLAYFLSEDHKTFHTLFDINVAEFWEHHYTFKNASKQRSKHIGKMLQHSILINVTTPFLFVYGRIQNKPELEDKALKMLNELPPEHNNIVKKWEKLGVKPESAADTQALLELKNEYCSAKKCLNCSIGVKLLNKG